MRDFYFKRRAGKLLSLLSDHLTQMQSKERKSVWEKRAVQIQYLRSDEMLTGLMSVALFYCYFRNLWNKKSLTSEKNELSCQMLYCAGGAHSSIALARTRRRAVMLYNFTKEQKLQALQQYSTMKVAYSTNKSHNCTACVCFEGFAWRCDIHSIQEQFPRFINSSLGCFNNPKISWYFHFVSFCRLYV